MQFGEPQSNFFHHVLKHLACGERDQFKTALTISKSLALFEKVLFLSGKKKYVRYNYLLTGEGNFEDNI